MNMIFLLAIKLISRIYVISNYSQLEIYIFIFIFIYMYDLKELVEKKNKRLVCQTK